MLSMITRTSILISDHMTGQDNDGQLTAFRRINDANKTTDPVKHPGNHQHRNPARCQTTGTRQT